MPQLQPQLKGLKKIEIGMEENKAPQQKCIEAL